MKLRKYRTSWILAGVTTLALAAYLGLRLVGEDRRVFVPGAMTHGHHQIELACDACHAPFTGVKQEACIECHGPRLAASNDSHPRKKFEDPRNADRLDVLDARWCVTCHVEHRPARTRAMGVTLPHDYCFHCHQEVGDDRPSHKDLAFDSCASAGCHNYHDNTALYEDFLAKHAKEPPMRAEAMLLKRGLTAWFKANGIEPKPALRAEQQDAPVAGDAIRGSVLHEWSTTAHARSGVNCSGCHQPGKGGTELAWIDKPGPAVCATCHEAEHQSFLDSRHGMRLKQNLAPMTPGEARLPMRAEAHDKQLGCVTCHSAHSFDTRRAAVESCLGCHDDDHSRAFPSSTHAQSRVVGIPALTCATCHLPRTSHRRDGKDFVRVEHNQNWNLRPNEKMIKGVCLNCHGLAFSLDALADPALIANNFTGKPARHIESVDWAAQRVSPTSQGVKP